MSELIIPALPGTYLIWWDPAGDDGEILPETEAMSNRVWKTPVIAWCRDEPPAGIGMEPLTVESKGFNSAWRAVLFPDGTVWEDCDAYDTVEDWQHHLCARARIEAEWAETEAVTQAEAAT